MGHCWVQNGIYVTLRPTRDAERDGDVQVKPTGCQWVGGWVGEWVNVYGGQMGGVPIRAHLPRPENLSTAQP
jgi:hypothetical protein